MLTNTQRTLRVAIVVVGLVTTLCMIFVPVLGRRLLRRDYNDAVPQQGVATLALLVEERVESVTDKVYPPKALVRFREAVHRVRKVTTEDIAGLKVNQKVQIIYRIGKSGRVYVDSLAPLPAAGTQMSGR